MKAAVPLLVFALLGASCCVALAQADNFGGHAVSLPGGPSGATTGLGTKNTSAAPSATPDEESNTADVDDSLYRGKTKDSMGTMLRDDGMLHFKTHKNEKVNEVDAKKLFSSGTDPKFQGELAISGVSSIDKVAPKPEQAQENSNSNANSNSEPEDQSDPRFKTRRLIFNPENQEKPKKTDKPEAESSPSPSASPKAKTSSASKD